jgi:hypothetical protein
MCVCVCVCVCVCERERERERERQREREHTWAVATDLDTFFDSHGHADEFALLSRVRSCSGEQMPEMLSLRVLTLPL